MTTFGTASQIADWKRYEKVRRSGRYNMFFPQARAATGLDSERYAFVLKHYSELKAAAESVTPNVEGKPAMTGATDVS